MRGALVRLLIAGMLVTLGWVAGTAQSTPPDFMLAVDSPRGVTTVECWRGCDLAWIEPGLDTAKPQAKFSFECKGERCQSGRIGGWFKN